MKLYTFPLQSSTENTMNQYLNSFGKVMNYCNQVEKLKVPIPTAVPIWYPDGIRQITQAKTNAGIWKSAVSKNLIQLPKNILYYRPVYEDKSSHIKNSLQILADHPTDENTRQHALKMIFELDQTLAGQVKSIELVTQNIQSFEQKFVLDIGNLNDITARAMQDKQVNEKSVKDLKNEITDIEAQISQYDTWITVGEVAIGGGLALVAISFVMTAGTAAMVVLIIGIVVAGLGALEFLGLEIAKSVANSNLAKKKKALNEAEEAAASMHQIQSRLSTVLDASKDLQGHMSGMKGLWVNMGGFASDMRQMLEAEKASLNRETLLRTVQSLKNADTAANDYYQTSEQLQGMNFQCVDKEETISA